MAIQQDPTTGTRDGIGGQIGGLLRNNVRQYGILVAFVAILVIFQVLTDGILLTPQNITALIQQNAYVIIIGVGMLIVIVSGHIDLSVGAIVAFIGAIAAKLVIDSGVPVLLAIVLCLALGAVIGAWQGFWIAYMGIPSFIVTLAGMLVFRGLAQFVLNGRSEGPFPTSFSNISNGFLPDVGPDTGYNNLTILLGLVVSVVAVVQAIRDRATERRYGLAGTPLVLFLAKIALILVVVNVFTFRIGVYRGVPYVFLILVALFAVYAFVMRATVVGRHVYAIGGNEAAARLSGVKNHRVTFLVFVNIGILAALAGIVTTARLNSATPSAGVNFELEAIAASFVGGASASGGVGTVFGAIIGALVLGVLNNGMSLIGVDNNIQLVIKGLVLLAAVAFDVINKRRTGN